MEVLKDLKHTVRDLVQRSGTALTRFFPRKHEKDDAANANAFPLWGTLAGEVIDHKDSVIVKLELPGIRREDCSLFVEDGVLRVEGERHAEREYAGSTYWLMQRAYGSFSRSVELPTGVDPSTATATLRDGVLRVELKKLLGAASRRHKVEVQ